jgi:ABC-type uncharacterized transport system substrate-binding protein
MFRGLRFAVGDFRFCRAAAVNQSPSDWLFVGQALHRPTQCVHKAFRQGLRELGYVEGETIAIEWRFAEGKLGRFSDLANDLVRLKVDLIVTGGSGATRIARRATNTIPIVMAQDSNPVGDGFVASLARPGGNITGLTNVSSEVSGKRLELLTEIVPKLSRVTVLGNSTNPANALALNETQDAAQALGLKLEFLEKQNAKDVEHVFKAAAKARSQALLTLQNPLSGIHEKKNRRACSKVSAACDVPSERVRGSWWPNVLWNGCHRFAPAYRDFRR